MLEIGISSGEARKHRMSGMEQPSHAMERTDRAAPHGPVQDLSRFKLPPHFRGRPAWFVQLWWLVQSLLFAPSPQALYGWRRFLLRMFGAQIGPGVLLRPSVRVTYPWKVTIGAHSWIGDHVELYSLGPITIGDNVVISHGSYLCTGTHDTEAPAFDIVASPIVVEPEVWIASQVFVSPGVTIGRGAVIGARSLVTHDIPALAKAVGHPAKVVGSRRTRPAG
jgi:putative colanic acid biosynthesis acetyltransferase WcaF